MIPKHKIVKVEMLTKYVCGCCEKSNVVFTLLGEDSRNASKNAFGETVCCCCFCCMPKPDTTSVTVSHLSMSDKDVLFNYVYGSLARLGKTDAAHSISHLITDGLLTPGKASIDLDVIPVQQAPRVVTMYRE